MAVANLKDFLGNPKTKVIKKRDGSTYETRIEYQGSI